MPAAAYLLVALEAARQLSDVQESYTGLLCLSDIRFEHYLPLDMFSEAETAVEAQLIARKIDATQNYMFEVFLQDEADGDSWTKHCSGKIETHPVVEPSWVDFSAKDHDHALMNQAFELEPNVGVGLDHVRLCSKVSTGEFKKSEDDLWAYAVDPPVLNSILILAPMSIVSQRPPAGYHISSLASLTVSTRSELSGYGAFSTRVRPSEPCFVECDSEISHPGNTISLKHVRYQATKLKPQRPSLNSLFFKPVLLPDIATLSASQPMSISRCAELLTHKWPWCDVKISDVAESCFASILEGFGAADPEARLRFRSIVCSALPAADISDRVRLVNDSDASNKYHLLISGIAPPAVQLHDQLNTGGFFCCSKTEVQDLMSNQHEFFEFVCDIHGLDLDPWVLLRKVTAPGSAYASRRVVVFTDQQDIPSLGALKKTESIALKPELITRFCEQTNLARFDAVIIECPGESVITSWKGSELIPWLQVLLKFAESILWVTQDHRKNPFSNVIGSLLRTLQLEQPSLKVSWLVVDEMANEIERSFMTQVEEAYTRMLERENELIRRTRGYEQHILRYMPDDRLSASIGLSLPRKARSPLDELDYSLEFASPGEPVILSCKESGSQLLSDNVIEVCVEASVLDTDDLRLSNSKPSTEVSRARSGLFFAGKVVRSQNPSFPTGSRVVGWHPEHLHRKKLSAHIGYMFPYSCSMQPSQAASKYAAIAVASCVVDGAARARRGETFLLNVQGPLSSTIKRVCERFGASVLESHSGSKPDFDVGIQPLDGICVNGKPVDIAGYLHTDQGKETIQQMWQGLLDLPLAVGEHEVADYKDAFQSTKEPYSTVLLHRNAMDIVEHVPIYKKAAPMFTEDAQYVVIGGLGGLGRFICSWMIENGAKHITVISRSGAGTRDARGAVSAMEASGASIQCIKADACDRKAISETLSQIRSKGPIKGIINLAMVLGDAPMASMTAEGWDRVLRVKIDSSWILHEETLQDQLDFFILFSSIASVLGNRNQGNYNVANAALNAFAEHRQSLDLPGISVALGAMSKS